MVVKSVVPDGERGGAWCVWRRLIMLICVGWVPTVHVFVAGLPAL